MSEIEKMYENVGLIYCNKCRHDSELDCLYMCESKYPPFTTEKQLELFKLLIRHYKDRTILYAAFDTEKFDTETFKQLKPKMYKQYIIKGFQERVLVK